jgi:hypothetical protein
MSIYFRYGSYSHSVGECQVTIDTRPEFAQDGRVIAAVSTYTINGVKHAESTAALTAAITEMEKAYSYDGKSFSLVGTAHSISSNKYGIHVVGISYPQGAGAEYVGFRTYQIVIEARKPIYNSGVSDFHESVSISGGGPRKVWLETLNTPPIMQITQLQTLCFVEQRGTATGDAAYPAPMSPLFPGMELEPVHIEKFSPRQIDNGRGGKMRHRYTIAWRYIFGLPTRVNAYPHVTY